MQTIPRLLREQAAGFGDKIAIRYPDGETRAEVTFDDLMGRVERFARGLVALGIKPGEAVFHLADNSQRWIVADLGILLAGAVSVPRGADTMAPEAAFIMEHSGSVAAVLDSPAELKLLPDEGKSLRVRILLTGEHPDTISLAALEELGAEAELPEEVPDVATIVYTSGTTGNPKGVILTHANILHNMRAIPEVVTVDYRDRFLSILPSWHMFERTVEYIVLAVGATLSYSSLRTLKEDMRSEKPTYLVAVPRLYESIQAGFYNKLEAKKGFARVLGKFLLKRAIAWAGHRARLKGRLEDPRDTKRGSWLGAFLGYVFGAPLGLLGRKKVGGPVREAVGGRLRGAVSGGGMLALHLDRFLDALSLPIIVGYGLTETSPVVTIRRFEDNVLGTIGRAVRETELRVVDPTGKVLGTNEPGELEVRGPQVMRGYHMNEEATKAVLSEDGWFRTGDLVRMTEKGDIIFCGREKETIVLAGGENIEPYPIEAKILESPLVKQALVVGQDRKALGALVVPEDEQVERQSRLRGLSPEELLRKEISDLVSSDAGFKPRERVGRVAILSSEFNVEDGTMTRTLKLRRNAILDKYSDLVEGLYE